MSADCGDGRPKGRTTSKPNRFFLAACQDITYDLRPDRKPSKAAGTTGMTEAIVAAMAG